MIKTKLLLLIILLLFFSFADGQNFRHYGLENGLSQESVQCLLKDDQGFIWLGTQDGLNRFDGDRFEIYKNNPKDSTTLSDNFITSLLQDANKTIWVGTGNKGINFYNPINETFTKIGPEKANCTGLIEGNNATIYASFLDQGLYEVNNNIATNIPFFSNQQLHVTALFYADNLLWVGTKEGRIFYSTTENGLTFKEQVLEIQTKNITSIYANNNHVWLGTDNGLLRHGLKSEQTLEIQLLSGTTLSSEALIIENITFRNDTLFVASDNGLFVLENLEEAESVSIKKHYKGDQNTTNAITSNRVYDVLIEDEFLWIGTNKLDVLSLESPVFKTINGISDPKLFNAHVYSIIQTPTYLFVGTRGGLNCIDKNGKTTLITTETTGANLAYNVIRGMAIDAENNLWLATTKGVSIMNLDNFNPEKPRIISTYFNVNDETSISNNNTRCVFIDSKNTVWISTYGGGINRFTGSVKDKKFSFERYQHQGGVNSLSSDLNFNISEDTNGAYWIASENGLNMLSFREKNYEKPVFKIYYQETNNNLSLTSNSVLYTLQDSKGAMWVATQEGLCKYNEAEDNFTRYGTANGLTNTFIYTILEDNNGLYWVTTNDGIFSFNPESETFTHFTMNDGVQSTEFNLGAQFKYDEELYFGGVNGLNVFNPNDVGKLDKETSLIFTSLSVKENKITPVTTHYIIDKSITSTNKINFKHTDFPSYLTFSALDFRASKNNTFQYRLLPNDTEWNELGDRKEIQLLNLGGGSYTLEVQGKTRHKQWDKQPLQVAITVTPPWYKSKGAIIGYGLLTMGILFWLYRYQLARKIDGQEAARLRELNSLKSKLYTNITHEFRTPITVILGMAQNLKERLSSTETETETTKSLQLIENNSHNLLNLVNQMLDLAKLERGKLKLKLKQEDVVYHTRYLTECYTSYAIEKDNQLIFYNEEEQQLMDLDLEKYTQVVTNLISNAIKFSSKGKIVVHTSSTPQEFELKVKDSGSGISEKDLPFVFDRFYQTDLGKTEGEGSGIGLALSKELVHLMNGTIEVESVLHQGTTFTVKLPIRNETEIAEVHTKTPTIFKPVEAAIEVPSKGKDLPLVLVVEDNQDVATYIISCLEDRYEIKHATDGEAGTKLAIKTIPDIIVSDIMMPIMNGYELCDTVKKDVRTNHIPVILLTAKASHEDKITGLELGADAYLTKPFSKKELLIRMEQLIALRATLQNKYLTSEILTHTAKPAVEKSVNDIFVADVVKNILANLDKSSYNALYLSRDMNLSESQLYRKLKAITNTSTAIFIRKIRLEKSKELLLEDNDMTISEVGYATGFNDPSWFSKAYKEVYGHAPSEEKKIS